MAKKLNSKIYGAFAYRTASERLRKDFAKKEVDTTIKGISEKANKTLETRKYFAIDIMAYNPKKMAWELMSSKMRYNLEP